MATSTSWHELFAIIAEAETRANDATVLEEYHWQLLEASAHLSTARLIIAQPTPTLDATEQALLEPLEAGDAGLEASDAGDAGDEGLDRVIAALAPGVR